MSLYAEYIKERMGDEIVENDYSFATYRFINEKQVYIIDIFVKPEYRQKYEAVKIGQQINEIAKASGRTEIIGSVCPQAKNATLSIQGLVAHGFKLLSSSETLILFKKEI